MKQELGYEDQAVIVSKMCWSNIWWTIVPSCSVLPTSD